MLISDVCSLPRTPAGVGQWGVVQLQRSLYQYGVDVHCENSELTISINVLDSYQKKMPPWSLN